MLYRCVRVRGYINLPPPAHTYRRHRLKLSRNFAAPGPPSSPMAHANLSPLTLHPELNPAPHPYSPANGLIQAKVNPL